MAAFNSTMKSGSLRVVSPSRRSHEVAVSLANRVQANKMALQPIHSNSSKPRSNIKVQYNIRLLKDN